MRAHTLKKKYVTLLKKKGFSPFEIKVYKAAARIPSGRMRSYKWIAQKIGSPNASRAVGNALNKNAYPSNGTFPLKKRGWKRPGRTSVIIPCHRVIRSDGSIGGFSKGSRAKRELLEREGIGIIK